MFRPHRLLESLSLHNVPNRSMTKSSVLILVLLVSSTAAPAAQRPLILNDSRQCIVVVTDSWDASQGVLQRFQRIDHSRWRQVAKPISVRIGRAGLAWGRGEVDPERVAGPTKWEGDNKAPAGVFRLGTACGYAANPPTRMPYLRITEHTVAVDDPASRYYNQIVDTTKIPDKDWRTAEKPVLADVRYKWGIVVRHNMPPIAGRGSCIFLHVWKDSSTSTSGCTAMSEKHFLKLFAWLNPSEDPVLVQLPRPVYNELRSKWSLPEL
jgi:zinc D-Ala-D-Ala dipeptidase